ncbi:MAG TPA: DegT/DnrJ/EryC1/StrS family aminotransferase, partial [Trinickia sp.]|nr:DegT/DnrJ/EryC1/StrS family aminotransferase [Trinickia sp.]
MTHVDAMAASRTPAFAQPVIAGQHNRPSWERYTAAMKGIFERRYYTNQGPLAREFEERLQAFLGVKHAVCVTNPTIGLMMASEALAIAGRALVPGVANLAVEHALAWCGVEAVFCDVDPATGQISLERAAELADAPSIHAIVGANLWGSACQAEILAGLARIHDVPVLFDSAHAFGCEIDGARAGRFAPLEVLAFGESDILNAAGGACVATDDDELAARLRNIRSSYGAGRPVKVVKTSNGRLSEAQAAMGLLSLEDHAANRAHNRALFDAYRERMS